MEPDDLSGFEDGSAIQYLQILRFQEILNRHATISIDVLTSIDEWPHPGIRRWSGRKRRIYSPTRILESGSHP